MLDNTSDVLYLPEYLTIYMLLLILIYISLLIYFFNKFKFNRLGITLILISLFTFGMVAIYTLANGYFVDANPEHMRAVPNIGFMEIIFLPYPYIFLILAVTLGRKN